MKAFTVSLFALCSVSLTAFAAENKNYQINLNWAKKETLKDQVVQLCDDTYYPAVELRIPGKGSEDFSIEMDADISSGKAVFGCQFRREYRDGKTTFFFNATTRCTIRVFKLKVDGNEAGKSAVYEISDAC